MPYATLREAAGLCGVIDQLCVDGRHGVRAMRAVLRADPPQYQILHCLYNCVHTSALPAGAPAPAPLPCSSPRRPRFHAPRCPPPPPLLRSSLPCRPRLPLRPSFLLCSLLPRCCSSPPAPPMPPPLAAGSVPAATLLAAPSPPLLLFTAPAAPAFALLVTAPVLFRCIRTFSLRRYPARHTVPTRTSRPRSSPSTAHPMLRRPSPSAASARRAHPFRCVRAACPSLGLCAPGGAVVWVGCAPLLYVPPPIRAPCTFG
ncbi:hypothetical protein DFH07DRAFT_951787 [Mycena maculata]|uniref:Uncharacterized protein n=1 Tax=Mycena maculata TaxID=230809 RepID=A0AAD7K247_9AGAR|nr:hypothetical protein DFH07DRAFT_951787 [Mycena maculata]